MTKQNYDLLLFFLKKDGALASKDEIIEEVWKGRVVADNTVDKSFTKLKKVLNSCEELDYFESQYGLGMKFLPDITFTDDIKIKIATVPQPQIKSKKMPFIIAACMALLAVVLILVQFNDFKKNQAVLAEKTPKPLLLILSQEKSDSEAQWWSANNIKFIQQILGESHDALIKDYKSKPQNLTAQQYLEYQWDISPELKVLTTKIRKDNDQYTLEYQLKDKNQKVETFSVSNKNFNQLYTQANNWLIEKTKNQGSRLTEINLPKNQILLENYLRGLAEIDKGEDEKAAHYFEICIIEDSQFSLARLALAEVKNRLGMQQQALGILDTLSSIDSSPYIEIHSESLKGLIYNKTGKPDLALETYHKIVEKYKDSPVFELKNIQLNLSYLYAGLTENDKAINQLDKLIVEVSENEFPEFIAEVYRKKASLLQKIGKTSLAKESINKAKILFNQLGDLIGEAKVYTTLARLAVHEADYQEATKQLNHSLAIVRAMKNKIGIGATLNELIYVQLTQGQFEKAWNLNQELESIATEIDYAAMLLASKQFFVDIARVRQQWQKAEIYLKQHKDLAIKSNNKRAEINNKLLEVDLLLDSGNLAAIPSILDTLQVHIDDKKEIRLQPRVNIKRARYLSLTNNNKQSKELLNNTFELAVDTKDTESMIAINNQLAEIYISQNLADDALDQLKKSKELKPFSYPYELLLSKSFKLKGEFIKAVDLANQCKNKANEFWQTKDDLYLANLNKSINQSIAVKN
ncbi:MAG: winged helix-turn-helix domain-containing protein [Marinicellaceae bacterium]